MTIMQKSMADRTYEQAVAAMDLAAHALYNAEVALHDAHQTHVDQWIAAAQDHLHLAVAEHGAASHASRPCAIRRSPLSRPPSEVLMQPAAEKPKSARTT